MDEATQVSISHIDAPKGRIYVMPAYTEDGMERFAELEKLRLALKLIPKELSFRSPEIVVLFSAEMDKRYQNKLVRLDRFADEEIITFRYLAAKFSKGWGRAEIRSGIIIQAESFIFKNYSILVFL